MNRGSLRGKPIEAASIAELRATCEAMTQSIVHEEAWQRERRRMFPSVEISREYLASLYRDLPLLRAYLEERLAEEAADALEAPES